MSEPQFNEKDDAQFGNQENSSEEMIEEILEKDNRPSLIDKFSGIFISPSDLFENIKKSSPHYSDWLYPILLFVIIAALVNFLSMSDPEISMKIEEKQMEKIEKNFDELVKEGTMPRETADEQLETIRENIDKQMQNGKYIQALSLLVVTFVFFFVLTGFYYLVIRFGLKGKGNYFAAMTAYGLPYYILALEFVVVLLYVFLTKNPASNLSVATLLNYSKDSYAGILLDKLDIFGIWFYYLISLGFSKLFETDLKKTVVTIFSIWIGASLFFHFLAEQISFLKFFGL